MVQYSTLVYNTVQQSFSRTHFCSSFLNSQEPSQNKETKVQYVIVPCYSGLYQRCQGTNGTKGVMGHQCTNTVQQSFSRTHSSSSFLNYQEPSPNKETKVQYSMSLCHAVMDCTKGVRGQMLPRVSWDEWFQGCQGTKGAKGGQVKSSKGLLGGRVFSRTHFRSSLTPEEGPSCLEICYENSTFLG